MGRDRSTGGPAAAFLQNERAAGMELARRGPRLCGYHVFAHALLRASGKCRYTGLQAAPLEPHPARGEPDPERLQAAGPRRGAGQSGQPLQSAPETRRNRQGSARADPENH